MTAPARPQRIQRRRTKGWKMPENAVYVGRPTQWGNPYPPAGVGGREAAVALFRRYACWRNHDGAATLRERAKALRGKDLACWCPLDQPCHADVLLELANEGRA